MIRRHAFRSALALALAPLLRRSAPADEVARLDSPPGATIDPSPMIFRLGGQHVRVDPVGRALELVDRRELFGHLPDPEPATTTRFQPGDPYVVRTWGEADPSASCSRCRWACNASRSQAGDFRCIQAPDA